QPFGQLALQQEQVTGGADLQLGAAAYGRAGLEEVGGVEEAGAVLALVAAGPVVAAVGAGADDVAVGEEATVDVGVHLLGLPLLDVAVGLQGGGDVAGQIVVRRCRAAPEVVPRQPEALAQLLLPG